MDIFVAAGQMLVLFAMMFTGYFLARRDWINDSLSSALSRLVVNIFNPFLMISSVFGQSLKQSGPLFWENLVLVGIFYLLLFLAGFFIVFVLRPTSQMAPIYKLLTSIQTRFPLTLKTPLMQRKAGRRYRLPGTAAFPIMELNIQRIVRYKRKWTPI